METKLSMVRQDTSQGHKHRKGEGGHFLKGGGGGGGGWEGALTPLPFEQATLCFTCMTVTKCLDGVFGIIALLTSSHILTSLA